MKRKLIGWLFLLCLGGASPKIADSAVEWWKTPTPPPRDEAAKLVASLERAEGWEASVRYKIPVDCPIISKGKKSSGLIGADSRGCISVILRTWHADVEMDHGNINDCFTWSELRAIQRAGENCLRKITERALRSAQ